MIGVAGIPWDANSSYLKGPALAPEKIRASFHSDSANYFTESGVDLKNHPGWRDLGDVSFPNGEFFSSIEQQVSRWLGDHDKLLLLGGDHSVTYPIVSAFHARHQSLNILHIDAHSDLYPEFDGNPYSHASPFARIMEKGLAARLVQVGIRTLSKPQKEMADRYGVEIHEMKHWVDDHHFEFKGPVYLSLDIDALDPAFAPGVSHFEPGGLSTRQVIHLLQQLEGNVVGADLVELNPNRDPSGVTGMVAAKLFKEMLDLLLRTK